MTSTNKDFKVKNGINVAGPAVFASDLIIGDVPLAFDSTTNRLKIQVDGVWSEIALLTDAETLSFEDINVSIDYDGTATYIVQANGVTPSGESKFADGGTPLTTQFRYVFDSGSLV